MDISNVLWLQNVVLVEKLFHSQTRPDVDAARRDSLFGTEVDSGDATPAGTPHVQGEARGFDEGRERPATAMPGTTGPLVQNVD